MLAEARERSRRTREQHLDYFVERFAGFAPQVGDVEALEYIAQLTCAAQLLAQQLNRRRYGGKPPSRKQLKAARESQENWGRVTELAGDSSPNN